MFASFFDVPLVSNRRSRCASSQRNLQSEVNFRLCAVRSPFHCDQKGSTLGFIFATIVLGKLIRLFYLSKNPIIVCKANTYLSGVDVNESKSK
jgi:hypothetical protein